MDDYFALGTLIAARLRERVPELRAVLETADLGGAVGDSPATPSVYVAWGGESVPGDETRRAGAGALQMVEQHWLVVLAVYAPQGDAAPRREAGRLLWQINRALQGWVPGAEFCALSKGPTPAPLFDEGYGFFPLTFTAALVLPGST